MKMKKNRKKKQKKKKSHDELSLFEASVTDDPKTLQNQSQATLHVRLFHLLVCLLLVA